MRFKGDFLEIWKFLTNVNSQSAIFEDESFRISEKVLEDLGDKFLNRT